MKTLREKCADVQMCGCANFLDRYSLYWLGGPYFRFSSFVFRFFPHPQLLFIKCKAYFQSKVEEIFLDRVFVVEA
jgi:hypothetical protein